MELYPKDFFLIANQVYESNLHKQHRDYNKKKLFTHEILK